MGVSEPGPGVPVFTAMGYVDDQRILHYDSETQRQEPRGDWVQGAVSPDFWDTETWTLWDWQDRFESNLVTLRDRYNQTRGKCEQAGASRRHSSCPLLSCREPLGTVPAAARQGGGHRLLPGLARPGPG